MNTNRARKHAFKPVAADARLEAREVLSTVVPANPVFYYNPLQRRVPTDLRTQPLIHATPPPTTPGPISPYNPLQRRVPTDLRNQPIVHTAPQTTVRTNVTPAGPVSYFSPFQRRVPTNLRTQPIFNAFYRGR